MDTARLIGIDCPRSRRKAGLHTNTDVRFEINRGVVTLKNVDGARTRGRRLVEMMRGKATASLTTDQIMGADPALIAEACRISWPTAMSYWTFSRRKGPGWTGRRRSSPRSRTITI